jgi:hypothetical protein
MENTKNSTESNDPKKQYISLKGWNWQQDRDWDYEANVTCSYDDFEEDEMGGRVITQSAARKMVHQYWDTLRSELEQKVAENPEAEEQFWKRTGAITFSKRILLLLLSQKDCEGIRFYICQRPKRPQDKKEGEPNPNNPSEELITSLMLTGITKGHKDLGATSKYVVLDQHDTTDNPAGTFDSHEKTIYAEVGGHDTLAALNGKLELGLFGFAPLDK